MRRVPFQLDLPVAWVSSEFNLGSVVGRIKNRNCAQSKRNQTQHQTSAKQAPAIEQVKHMYHLYHIPYRLPHPVSYAAAAKKEPKLGTTVARLHRRRASLVLRIPESRGVASSSLRAECHPPVSWPRGLNPDSPFTSLFSIVR